MKNKNCSNAVSFGKLLVSGNVERGNLKTNICKNDKKFVNLLSEKDCLNTARLSD